MAWGLTGQQRTPDNAPAKLSLHVPSADEFDEAVRELTKTKNTANNNNNNDIIKLNNDGNINNTQQIALDGLYSKYMEEYKPDSMVGPLVSDDLSKTVNLFSNNRLSTDKLKERRARELRPENVELFSRITNGTVFKLNVGDISHARSTDMKLQTVEKDVVKATYPILRAVDELQKLQQPALTPAISKIMDGIILLTDSVQDCQQTRRSLYKNILPESWKGILEKPEGPHEELFGDIDARLKACQTEQKIQDQVLEEQAKESKRHTPHQEGNKPQAK